MSLYTNLKLLSLSKDFRVEEIDSKHFSYLIQSINSDSDNPIECIVKKNDFGWEENYFLTGCYDSGSDYLEIDMSELSKLQNFIKSLID